jgi:hypothetical protein
MFARRVRVEYEGPDGLQLCPIKWLDNFSMRDFTNDQIFDDTLPTADGVLEVGSRVPLDRLKEALEDWFQRKGYLPKGTPLLLKEG